MGLLKWTAILFLPVVFGIYIALFGCSPSEPIMPDMSDGWWGLGEENSTEQSSAIKPFKIKVGMIDYI